MDISQKIFDLLKQRNITAYRLSKDCDIPETTISHWKSGRQTPSTQAIIKLAKYFDVTSDYLIGLSDNPNGCRYCVNTENN